MKLDGEHVAAIPFGPAALPVARPLVHFACWLRNTIARYANQV